ncbi:hypothetical protein F4775DRAFT_587988 [Biscogniauxia sp. FL1348]|nr:hypothetical protein F4775DRAFT_587988 [Biscogniauxia sp. FL1348]
MGAKKKSDDKGKGKDAGGKGKDEQKDAGKVKKGGQKLRIRHILCEKHSKKEEAMAEINERIQNSSEAPLSIFIDVARKYSEDKAKLGGLLGDVTKGSLDPAFEAEAWKLPESKGSSISIGQAKTSNGYHLIVVEPLK